MTTRKITINYYDATATKIVRVGTYTSHASANRAMRRARAKGRICQPAASAR